MFMRVTEVAEALDVSEPYAYKLIRKLNEELKQKGCIVIAGRIDRRFFYEKFYGSNTKNWGGIKIANIQKRRHKNVVCHGAIYRLEGRT